jgi:RimJ/RimL family protein N-acetyltransferase
MHNSGHHRADPREAGAQYFIATGRIGFRLWTPADLPLAVTLWGDPRVMELLDKRRQLTEEQVKERLDREIANQQRYGIQYWPFFLLETGNFVGCCGLKPYIRAPGCYELGFHLVHAFWGRGFATEAGQAVVRWSLEHLKPVALIAGHHPMNTGSRRVIGKLGFVYVRDEYFPGTNLMHRMYELRSPGG